jgi:SAM-dependent methyltransferase
MTIPSPWQEIGRHAMLPHPSLDERTHLDMVAQLNVFATERLAPAVKRAYDRQGVTAADRHEVRKLMDHEPSYRTWSLLRRNTMEMRQHVVRELVARQRAELAERARKLNQAGELAGTLKLDPSLEIPRYVSAVDQHLLRGGYTLEVLEDDVSNAANYDAGMFATLGGGAGPWNNAAGRALVSWLRENFPAFYPSRIVDLGCGLGHNTLPLRKCFPHAEIIAIDVAAPMLRYGHARARSLGITDVQFWQQDAVRTSLPTGSCDLVFTTMVLHETSKEALPKFFQEAHRLLRAGGLTIHLEQPTYRGLPPLEQFMRDWDGKYNNEPFWSALHETDLPGLLNSAGFSAENVFESRCVAANTAVESSHEDFGRAPAWYAVGAWQAADGDAASE